MGSSNYITNLAGNVSQHTCPERLSQRVEYLPFGETLVEEHLNSNNSPYKFNGKELDEETGNYYYGARYYDPKTSIWLSVDPLAEKYPGWSPYNYTLQNPVNLVDPDGNSPWPPFSFGLSLGTGGFKANFNISISQNVGDFNASYGIGATYHSNFYNTGKGGVEFRNSFMVNYDDGQTGGSLGTNFWSGTGGMAEFSQRTGFAAFNSGDFNFSYENDGTPFQWIGLGDGNDSYRTAATSFSVGDFSLNVNLLTGLRNKNSYQKELKSTGGKTGLPQGQGAFGEFYNMGFVNEKGSKYRFGGLSLNYNGLSAGTNSEWIRHAFQNKAVHGFLSPQRQFEMQSGDWKPIYNISNQGNSEFTNWGR